MIDAQRNASPSPYIPDPEEPVMSRSISPIPRTYNQNSEIDDITLFLQSHTAATSNNNNSGGNLTPDISDDALPNTIHATLALTSTSEAASPVCSVDTSMDALPFDNDVSVHFGMNDVVDDDDDDYDGYRHGRAEFNFYEDTNQGEINDNKIYDFYDYDNDTDYAMDSDVEDDQPGSQQRYFHFNTELKERLKQCHEEQQRREAEERRTGELDETFTQRRRTNSLAYSTSNYNSHTIVPPKPDAKQTTPSAQLLPLQTTTVSSPTSLKTSQPEVKAPITTTSPQQSSPNYVSPPPPPPPSRQTSYQPSLSPQNLSPTLKQSPSSPHLVSPKSISPRNSPPSPTSTQPISLARPAIPSSKNQPSNCANVDTDNYREKDLVPPLKMQQKTSVAQYVPGYSKDDEYSMMERGQNTSMSVPLFTAPNNKFLEKSPIVMRNKNQELAKQKQQQQQQGQEGAEGNAHAMTKIRSTSITSAQRPTTIDQKQYISGKTVHGHLDLTLQQSFSKTSQNQQIPPPQSPPPPPPLTTTTTTTQQGTQGSLSPKISVLIKPSSSSHAVMSASPSYHSRAITISSQPQKVPQLHTQHVKSTSVSPTQQLTRPTATSKFSGPVSAAPSQSLQIQVPTSSGYVGTSPSARIVPPKPIGPVLANSPQTQKAQPQQGKHAPSTQLPQKVQQPPTSPRLEDISIVPQQQASSVPAKLVKPTELTSTRPQRMPQPSSSQFSTAMGISPVQPLVPRPIPQHAEPRSKSSSPTQKLDYEGSAQVILPAAAGSLTWQKRQLQPCSPNLQTLAFDHQQQQQPPALQATAQQGPQQQQQQAQSDPVLKMIHGSAGQQFTTITARFPARAGSFKPEFVVKPCRFFGVHLQNLSREQLTRKFVPNIVERSLNYLEVAIINCVEGGKEVYTLKKSYPRISTWTAKDTQKWLETEFGLDYTGLLVETNRLTGKRLLALTEREMNELFGDSILADKIMSGLELTDSLQRRGDNIVKSVYMDGNSINELFTLVDMWNGSINQVVDYFKLKSTPSVVCALLKQYLRDLPVPLLPLQAFSTTSPAISPSVSPQPLFTGNPNVDQRKKKAKTRDFSWNKLLQMKQNFNTVMWETVNRLIGFLNYIAYDERSLVSVSAISEAFGPAIFKPQSESEEKLSKKAVRELIKTYTNKNSNVSAFNQNMTPKEFIYGEIIVSGESNVRCYFGPTAPCTLQGADYAEFINARHWINGVIYFTNYRLIWEPNFSAADREKSIAHAFVKEIPIASITGLNIVKENTDKQEQKEQKVDVFVGKIATRDMGIYYLQFNALQTLVRFTEEVARTKEIAPFGWANKELDYLSVTQRRELGWNIYRPEKQLRQFIGESRGFSIQDTLKLYSLSSSDDVYPRNCVVSSLLLPNFMTLIKEHKLVPVLTWVSEHSSPDRLRGVFRTVIYRSKNYKYDSCMFKKQALADDEAAEEAQAQQESKKEDAANSKSSRLSFINRVHRRSTTKITLSKTRNDDEEQFTSFSSSPTASLARRKEEYAEKKDGADNTTWAMFYKAYKIRMVLVMDPTGVNKPGFLERQGSVTLEIPGFTSISRRYINMCNMFINYQGTEEWSKAQREAVGQWTSMIHDILFSTVMVSNMISSQKNSILLQPASNEEDDLISALSSLAAIMVDGRARTIEGFVELIEREWIEFGFPYAKSHGDEITDITVNTTVLIVFLDCVWQLWTCFPESFEFNEALLLFIAENVHSGRFGTFYTNMCCVSCAAQLRSKAGIPSLWAYILTHKEGFTNPLCTHAALSTPFTQRFSNEFVTPNLWAQFYMRWKAPANEDKYARQLRKAKRANKGTVVASTERGRALSAVNTDNANEQLDFSNLGLSVFPQVQVPYSHLAHIKDLNLSGNSISSLPASLYSCSALAKLDISHNSLTAPFSVEAVRALSKHVPDLAVLDISYNRIECLPANFAELCSVRKLNIGGNNFKEFPRQIFDMRLLRSLSLENGITQTMLSSIPFSRLESLEELILCKCKLTEVPAPEIMNLKSLRILDLSNNEITNVDNFPCLPSLQILNLSYNRISSLPITFSNLVGLVDLNLHHNCLTELTPAVGQLRQLSRLVISENNLKSLPPTLSKLSFLVIGDFIHDSGLFPPECNTTQKKLANLQSLLTHKLGNPAVGKTVFLQCLVKKYKKHSDNMQTISTDGVDITPWHFDWKDESGEVRSVSAKIWDFAGQVIYTSTHHFFLTSQGVYVLVWKLPLGDTQCRLPYWLNLISIATKSATVYIVGTHTDSPDMTSARVDKIMTDARARYARMYPQLKLYFRAISNLTKEGLKKVREEIKETICATLSTEETVPYQYLMLEHQISKWHCIPPILSRKEWEMTARCCDINTEEDLSRATEFLHMSGSLICFQKIAALRNYVILDPQWMTNTLSTVITHKHGWVKNGILQRSNLVHIWKPPEFPTAVYPVILDLLEAFNVMFWLPAKNVPHILDAVQQQQQGISQPQAIPPPPPPSGATPTTSPRNTPNTFVRGSSPTSASPNSAFMTSPVRGSSTSSNPSTPPPLSSPTTILVPSPSPTSSLSASPTVYGLSPKSLLAHQRAQFRERDQKQQQTSEILRRLGLKEDESVIFLPALLPETAPDYSKVWRTQRLADEEEIGRRYSFQCLPESLFSKLLVIFSHTYNFFAIWRNGVVMEVRNEDRSNELRSVILIRQSIEANTLDVRVRYSTMTGGNEIVFAGELFQDLLGVIGRTIRDWYRVKVATFVMCSSCLEKGIETPFLCRYDTVENAVSEGMSAIHCREEDADIPLTKMAPDMVISHVAAENKEYKISFADLTLLNVIGEGAAASVYKAQYRGDTVAVKMFKLEREGLGMFADQAPAYDLSLKIAECRREMAVMSKCRMPNILELRGFVTRPLCLVIDYADGGSLYSYIHDTTKQLEWPLRLKFAFEVASAIQTLHSAEPPIIHRDLKSPNVLLKLPKGGEEMPRAILCDFGLSGKWESQSIELAVENPIWTAPEVLKKEDCTTKSDVYSMGVILWELLTREDFMSNFRFMGEIADAVVSGDRPKIPEVPEEYQPYTILIEKCWDQEPARRPASCNIVAILSSMMK